MPETLKELYQEAEKFREGLISKLNSENARLSAENDKLNIQNEKLSEENAKLLASLKKSEASSSGLSTSLQEWEGYLQERGIGSLESLKKHEDALKSERDELTAKLKEYKDLPRPEDYRRVVEGLKGRESAVQKREEALSKDLHVTAWRRSCKALIVLLLVSLVFFTVFLFLLSGWLSSSDPEGWGIPRIFGAIKNWIAYSLRR